MQRGRTALASAPSSGVNDVNQPEGGGGDGDNLDLQDLESRI